MLEIFSAKNARITSQKNRLLSSTPNDFPEILSDYLHTKDVITKSKQQAADKFCFNHLKILCFAVVVMFCGRIVYTRG